MAAGVRTEAQEIIKRLEGGITRPFLCRAPDGKEYVAKGRELPPQERIAEILAARLAQAFGLPIPDHGYIYIDAALLTYTPEYQSHLGAGDSFALEYLATGSDLQYSQVQDVSEALQRLVFVFDFWIGNGDRNLGPNGGRVNLMMNNGQLQLIDHNLAFKWDFSTESFSRNHVFGLDNRRWELDLLHRVECQERMRKTVKLFRSFCTDIPAEWCQDQAEGWLEDQLTRVEQRLMRFESDDFWGGLR